MRTLLVANRGEIALRVMRSAHARGLCCVAVFTDADAGAPHVLAADRAVRVDSYLDVAAVVAAAVASGADAVHPGYGFLSERAELAAALEAAGVTLVGPSSQVMAVMGRKDAAREVALAAGVPVVPSWDLAADGLAFPVLVKAAAGGGGKGMRVVAAREGLDEAVASARREALSAFGDDTLLVEAYVERGRHVEVQVLADAHGHVVHLFERDCSTQRRHQKVVEEAPAPTIDAATRGRLTGWAVALASEVGYVGAGTVEFLLDEATGSAYFLEMNTRLQVEHPVTELVTGLDLVDLQLRVAAGEELPFAQEDLRVDGHAIEARIYAEDPYAGFLPQAGTAVVVRWPAGVRVDQALGDGQVVGTAYDPMLAKVVAHGPDRETARRRLVAALDRTAVLGLSTNAGFVRALLETDELREATLDTAWLDRHEPSAPDPALARVIAAWTDVAAVTGAAYAGPWSPDGWRLGAAAEPVRVALDRPLLVDRAAGLVLDGPTAYAVTELEVAWPVVVLDVDGRREWAAVDVTDAAVELAHRGQRFVFERPDPTADHAAVADGLRTAPMPGTLLAVDVAAGARVAAGDRLGVLEAMKMELALTAPFAGTVSEVGAAAGDQVALGARLFLVEPDEPDEPEPGPGPEGG